MKMNKIIGKAGLLLLGAGFIALTAGSCRKEGETVAKITVVDTGGVVFPNAMVRLYPSPTIPGQAGVAVLDIEVRSGDTLYAQGIIKIEQEQTTNETVVIQ
jgi:hypothetical protein